MLDGPNGSWVVQRGLYRSLRKECNNLVSAKKEGGLHDAADVEVDVGSADMNQFNVAGPLDNAVKESRERIKAALKNRAFAFP